METSRSCGTLCAIPRQLNSLRYVVEKMTSIYNKFNLKKYEFEDLIGSDLKTLFILESPHLYEFKEKCIAAGETGIIMSKYLINEEKALGILLKEEDKRVLQYGIINVSKAPIQAKFYIEKKDYYNHSEILTKFQNLRYESYSGKGITYHKKHIECLIKKNSVIKQVCCDFKKRLSNIINTCNGLKTIVPCGVIAQTFFEYIYISSYKQALEKNNCDFLAVNNQMDIKINNKNFELFYAYHPVAKLFNNSWNRSNKKLFQLLKK